MSRFGSGGALSRRVDYTGQVDTVYLGAWRRETLLACGGFDEMLVRNQDDELNLRLKRSGGMIWQSSAIRSYYEPRDSYRALFRQFFQYGYWKVPVMRKHRLPASPRQVAPFLFVSAIFLLALGALASTALQMLFVAVLGTYFACITAASGSLVNPRRGLRIGGALTCMHFGYGLGFGRGLLDFLVLRRGPNAHAAQLTR